MSSHFHVNTLRGKTRAVGSFVMPLLPATDSDSGEGEAAIVTPQQLVVNVADTQLDVYSLPSVETVRVCLSAEGEILQEKSGGKEGSENPTTPRQVSLPVSAAPTSPSKAAEFSTYLGAQDWAFLQSFSFDERTIVTPCMSHLASSSKDLLQPLCCISLVSNRISILAWDAAANNLMVQSETILPQLGVSLAEEADHVRHLLLGENDTDLLVVRGSNCYYVDLQAMYDSPWGCGPGVGAGAAIRPEEVFAPATVTYHQLCGLQRQPQDPLSFLALLESGGTKTFKLASCDPEKSQKRETAGDGGGFAFARGAANKKMPSASGFTKELIEATGLKMQWSGNANLPGVVPVPLQDGRGITFGPQGMKMFYKQDPKTWSEHAPVLFDLPIQKFGTVVFAQQVSANTAIATTELGQVLKVYLDQSPDDCEPPAEILLQGETLKSNSKASSKVSFPLLTSVTVLARDPQDPRSVVSVLLHNDQGQVLHLDWRGCFREASFSPGNDSPAAPVSTISPPLLGYGASFSSVANLQDNRYVAGDTTGTLHVFASLQRFEAVAELEELDGIRQVFTVALPGGDTIAIFLSFLSATRVLGYGTNPEDGSPSIEEMEESGFATDASTICAGCLTTSRSASSSSESVDCSTSSFVFQVTDVELRVLDGQGAQVVASARFDTHATHACTGVALGNLVVVSTGTVATVYELQGDNSPSLVVRHQRDFQQDVSAVALADRTFVAVGLWGCADLAIWALTNSPSGDNAAVAGGDGDSLQRVPVGGQGPQSVISITSSANEDSSASFVVATLSGAVVHVSCLEALFPAAVPNSATDTPTTEEPAAVLTPVVPATPSSVQIETIRQATDGETPKLVNLGNQPGGFLAYVGEKIVRLVVDATGSVLSSDVGEVGRSVVGVAPIEKFQPNQIDKAQKKRNEGTGAEDWALVTSDQSFLVGSLAPVFDQRTHDVPHLQAIDRIEWCAATDLLLVAGTSHHYTPSMVAAASTGSSGSGSRRYTETFEATPAIWTLSGTKLVAPIGSAQATAVLDLVEIPMRCAETGKCTVTGPVGVQALKAVGDTSVDVLCGGANDQGAVVFVLNTQAKAVTQTFQLPGVRAPVMDLAIRSDPKHGLIAVAACLQNVVLIGGIESSLKVLTSTEVGPASVSAFFQNKLVAVGDIYTSLSFWNVRPHEKTGDWAFKKVSYDPNFNTVSGMTGMYDGWVLSADSGRGRLFCTHNPSWSTGQDKPPNVEGDIATVALSSETFLDSAVATMVKMPPLAGTGGKGGSGTRTGRKFQRLKLTPFEHRFEVCSSGPSVLVAVADGRLLTVTPIGQSLWRLLSRVSSELKVQCPNFFSPLVGKNYSNLRLQEAIRDTVPGDGEVASDSIAELSAQTTKLMDETATALASSGLNSQITGPLKSPALGGGRQCVTGNENFVYDTILARFHTLSPELQQHVLAEVAAEYPALTTADVHHVLHFLPTLHCQ